MLDLKPGELVGLGQDLLEKFLETSMVVRIAPFSLRRALNFFKQSTVSCLDRYKDRYTDRYIDRRQVDRNRNCVQFYCKSYANARLIGRLKLIIMRVDKERRRLQELNSAGSLSIFNWLKIDRRRIACTSLIKLQPNPFKY